LNCIAGCGALLQQHVPTTHQKNELPNHLVIL
jgi:putative membrane protein